MEKVLVINPEKCIGCSTCELACSFKNEGEFNPSKSRISVLRWPKVGIAIPLTCLQCDDPACEKVCMTGAIKKDPETGIVSINDEKCIGCKLCVSACPFGNIDFNPEERHIMKCDLCGGDPECVKFCPSGALEYKPASEALVNKKKQIAAKFSEIVKEVV